MFPGRLVSELLEEEQRLPVDTLSLMMEYGAYAQTLAALEHADKSGAPKSARPSGELAELCREHQVALIAEEHAGG